MFKLSSISTGSRYGPVSFKLCAVASRDADPVAWIKFCGKGLNNRVYSGFLRVMAGRYQLKQVRST